MSSSSRGLSSDRTSLATVSAASESSGRGGESKPPAGPSPPGLVLVATPIGNAADISARALAALAGANMVACEDTRVTAKLFAAHGLVTPLLPYHEHNAMSQRPKLIRRLKDGETVALVSDAGMPTISDPGYKLVAACINENIAVSCIPGASVVTTALVLSGLPTDRFFFQGFLPNKRPKRRRVLNALAAIPGSLVVMESAKRLASMLADAHQCLGIRDAAVTRELTKRFEEVRRGSLDELAAHYAEAGPPKGEVTVVIGPPNNTTSEIDPAALDEMLLDMLTNASVRDAANAISAETRLARRTVYQRALELNNKLSKDSR